jgi:Mitochondrial biogenesis AIM24
MATLLPPTSRLPTNHGGSSRTSSSLVESATSLPISNDDDNAAMMNPIDFDVALKIVGDESHVAQIELRPGETLRAESGAMLFMTGGIVSKSVTRPCLPWVTSKESNFAINLSIQRQWIPS